MAYTEIDDPSAYFQKVLYTGNGQARALTFDGNSDLQPDWVWIKDRDNVRDHQLFDSVRGVGKILLSNSTAAEGDDNNRLSAFNSNGFSVGTNTTVNDNSQKYVAWNWKAGTSFTNDASSTGIGTIDSTGSANDTAGFSICSYTGTGSNGTVKHGLNSAPKMIIVKSLGASESWFVYHADLTSATYTINLDTTGAQFSNASTWNSTAPSSSVFSIGTDAGTNGSSVNFIAYCFAEKQGYSKFGSYTGNGNADGTFAYTGFKPAWLMVRRTDGANSWIIMDNKRTTFNPMGEELKAEDTGTGNVATRWDQLSNGFKLRNAGAAVNASGGTYIYMCFAENPFTSSTGTPVTAR